MSSTEESGDELAKAMGLQEVEWAGEEASRYIDNFMKDAAKFITTQVRKLEFEDQVTRKRARKEKKDEDMKDTADQDQAGESK